MNEISSDNKFLAAIGHVCLQFANLETFAAVIIWVLLDLGGNDEKGAAVTGNLDAKQRIRMALNLLEECGAPNAFQRRLRAVQTKLTEGGLLQKRNLVVHGAHRYIEGDKRTLTMLRLNKAKRHQEVTLEEVGQLARDLHALANETYAIVGMVEGWHDRKHGKINGRNDLAVAKSITPKIRFIQRLYASAAHLWRNLFG